MWRRVSTGTSACTATARAPSTSPPTGPTEVAPTSTPRRASATSLMNPSLPALWIQPRAEAGRRVVTKPDGTVSTIDSPLANLARDKTLLSQGYLPGLTATDAVLGALTYLKDGQLTVADYKEAANLLAAASDKTLKVTVDSVVDMNTILGITGTITGADGKTYVDFSNYTYDRAATYPGTVTVLVKNADGTYSKQDVSIMEAVFNNTTYEGTGAVAFATAADDARAVISFVHDNPLPTD